MDRGKLLAVLAQHGVESIIVGGTAAVLNGAPISTFDLDVVYARTEENVGRLLAALEELQAIFRDDPRRLAPQRSHLLSAGHKLLATKYGPLDLLGSVEENTSYEDLLPDVVWYEVAGVVVRVVSLERLIAIKEKLTRDKDRAVMPVLRATLEEQRRASAKE
jgi:hypothetical protein